MPLNLNENHMLIVYIYLFIYLFTHLLIYICLGLVAMKDIQEVVSLGGNYCKVITNSLPE